MAQVITTLRDIEGRAVVTLPLIVRQALMSMDDVLRGQQIQFELICERCNQAHPHDPNRWTILAVHGGGDGGLIELVCGCTRRKFVAAF